jgi:magnesium-transporting ATPase (P-type)
LRRFGWNEPVKPAESHPLRSFVSQFTHTLALLLWFAAGLAFAASIPELGGAIVAVVTINGVFAFFQEYRAEQIVSGLMRHVAVQSHVMRDGLLHTLGAAHLVPGDVIRLEAGDLVPADCVVIEAEDLALDLSMLTGETAPAARSEQHVEVTSRIFRVTEVTNMCPAGAGVLGGTALAAVWATGPLSSVGTIANLVSTGRRASKLETQVAQLSRLTATIAVIAGAITLCLATLITQTTFESALTFSTGIIVALVPEGLLPILSVSLAIGASRMAHRRIAVRRLSAIEVLGSVTVICTDKTGTLTENAVVVAGCIRPDGSTTPASEMLLGAVLCNDALEEDEGFAGDAIDVALLEWARTSGWRPPSACATRARGLSPLPRINATCRSPA